MSYAWRQLQSAMRILASTGDRRDRLAGAYGKLIKLRPKDLPAEVSADYASLFSRISRFPVRHIPLEIKAEVEALSEVEVTEAIRRIMGLYDAVAAYQPRPVRHPGGPRHHASSDHVWPIPAMHILETRQGAFFHETA